MKNTHDSSRPLTLGIVTISYNQATYIQEAMSSVRMERPERLRYVIVDPGSTDGSRELILAEKQRFSSIIFEADRGPSDGLNKGFATCDADIFGYLNSDDRFTPGALDFVIDYFERNPKIDLIMGSIRVINEAGHRSRRARMPWSFSPQDFLDGTCTTFQQGTFFRRDLWERTQGFNLLNFTCWDTELLMDMQLAGARCRALRKILGEFRVYPSSITGSMILGRSQVMTEKHRNDYDRIRNKILNAGFSTRSEAFKPLRQLIFRFHPIRRVLELCIR